MRTSLLITLGFAVLAVSLAAKSKRNVDSKTRDVDKSTSETTEKVDTAQEGKSETTESTSKVKTKKTTRKGSKSDVDADAVAGETSSPKPKRVSRSATKNKTSQKTAKEPENDLEIEESLEDILPDDEVEIPSLNQLTTDTDPIELGRQIKNIKDDDTRRQLIAKLRKMWKANENSLPGKFYRAAYGSLLDENRAKKFWDNNLSRATKMIEKANETIFGDARNSLGKPFETVKNTIAADPVGMGLERGESIFLTVLSDALKNIGKVSDSVYDAAINTSGLIDAITSPVDQLPIAGPIKRNFHENVESALERGKFISGSLAENGSKALNDAAENANQRAQVKQKRLQRAFTSNRTI